MLAKHSLGQNFLTNQGVVDDIVATGKIKSGDVVLEVGPGRGILTAALLLAGAKVIAVEKNTSLVSYLETRFPSEIASGKLKLVHADITHYTLHITHYKIIANIPYYITGQFLRQIFEQENMPKQVVLLLQKEVAERIIAKNGKESILSISVKAYGEPSIVRYVTRKDFDPVPNVDSAVLLIEKISRKFFENVEERKFFELVKAGFAHKRKKLSNNLSLSGETAKLLGNKRAEELSLNDWRNLLVPKVS